MNNKLNVILTQKFFELYQIERKSCEIYRKSENFPKDLIETYYTYIKNDHSYFNVTKEAFVQRYIENESIIESAYEEWEKAGLGVMYKYAFSEDFKSLDLFSIIALHKKLFSTARFPEFGGRFRRDNNAIREADVETSDYESIYQDIKNLIPQFDYLLNYAKKINNKPGNKGLFDYIDKCIKLKCELIKIHPFPNGNGRTMRCFLNKLFELVGIPPVYLEVHEKDAYLKAMDYAVSKKDYSKINQFYYYKICDSLLELDTNLLLSQKQLSTEDLIKATIEACKRNQKKDQDSLYYSYAIMVELENKDIDVELHNTSEFDDNSEHSFLIIYGKQNYLIDLSLNLNGYVPITENTLDHYIEHFKQNKRK